MLSHPWVLMRSTKSITAKNVLPLFDVPSAALPISEVSSSTFTKNMSLPVHRWFRFSAGYSAEWVETVIAKAKVRPLRVFDPFAGSGTTLLAAERLGVESFGVESHPFVYRVASAKLQCHSKPDAFLKKASHLKIIASSLKPDIDHYPSLIKKCFSIDSLKELDALRQAYAVVRDESPASELSWLGLVSILRKVSFAGTAPWQYVLPKKRKRSPVGAMTAFSDQVQMMHEDMVMSNRAPGAGGCLLYGDARTCDSVVSQSANLVITSPPYPNNFDYADATRLEMSFLGEVEGWGDLQQKVRRHLVRSCSQHVPESSGSLKDILSARELDPIRSELSMVCSELEEIRKHKGGKKTYHLMVACYFLDLALTWKALRQVCDSPSEVCFVIGDSAPYGVYVPAIPWLGKLALAAGFKTYTFEKTRDRNIKWKNRKHRVPLQEGRLWVEG